ncbi:lytic polysaccharide monooxygenase [Erwinia sp. HDF1-3R]|uniref:lytic polysaccharide monooxygenase n=1 Tax=Erwinia sp. HDF1-3R TaxID=3141543 RepID=UPI0031F5BF4B
MKLNKIAIAIASLVVSSAAWSHGFVMDPPSRALLCDKITMHNPGYAGEKNKNCGNIQYEPQSLEAPKGYPASGPKDGQIGSANNTRGPELDAAGKDRWVKTEISAGKNQFHWYFTAPHPTTKYEYFITKNNWNPEQPLTRASFENKPFCTIQADGSRPGAGASVTHICDVPEREGYQEILAVWTVDDTSNAFYNVIDVEFAGHNTPDESTPDVPTPDETLPAPPPVEPPLNDDEEVVNAAPAIHIVQDHLAVNKSSINAGYEMDASGTQGATLYKWERVEGTAEFQLQSKQGSPTHTSPQIGKELKTMRAWVKAGATGKAKYRLTASNAHGSTTKYITIEVKDNDVAQDSSVPAFAANTAYSIGDKVSYKGHIYICLNVHTGANHWSPDVAVSLWKMVK